MPRFGYDAPYYLDQSRDEGSRWVTLPSGAMDCSNRTFLDEDYSAIENRNFFVRGILNLPIIGAAESFRWGIWASVSRTNFEALIRADEHRNRPTIVG